MPLLGLLLPPLLPQPSPVLCTTGAGAVCGRLQQLLLPLLLLLLLLLLLPMALLMSLLTFESSSAPARIMSCL
jgi:hypothetical protein